MAPVQVYAKRDIAKGETVEIAPSILLMNSEARLVFSVLCSPRISCLHRLTAAICVSSKELGRLLADYRYSAERLKRGLFRSSEPMLERLSEATQQLAAEESCWALGASTITRRSQTLKLGARLAEKKFLMDPELQTKA